MKESEMGSVSRITGLYCALWKQKASTEYHHTYRGISVSAIMAIVQADLINSCTKHLYESQLLTNQFGFLSGKGYNDGIYAIK